MKKVFILGLPGSGRTTVAKSLEKSTYIDTYSWIKSTFRSRKIDESKDAYEDSFHNYLSLRLTANPNIFIDNCQSTINCSDNSNSDKIVLDGINSPKDFTQLFDYNKDTVIFLNRNDNDIDHKDYENVALTVIRDYCFWLSAINLLPKKRWIELNFKMITDDKSDFVKELGSKNSVYLVKNIEKGISLINKLLEDI